MENKHPLILFSGGMDSTYLLWQKLLESDVHVCYIEAQQSARKILMEQAARQLIIRYLEELTGHKVLSDTLVKSETTAKTLPSFYGGTTNLVPQRAFDQPHLWLFGMQFAANADYHSSVNIAYVMGDQISCHLGDIKAAWDATSLFTRTRQVSLEFPLSYTTKLHIYENMPKELRELVWICELPVDEKGDSDFHDAEKTRQYYPCGICPACETASATNFILNQRLQRYQD